MLVASLIALARPALAAAEPPIADRPENYFGVVGVVRAETAVEPATVVIGERFQYRLALVGDVDFANVAPPALERWPAFRERFALAGPAAKTVAPGRCEFTYAVQATMAADRFPALALPTYNANSGQYEFIRAPSAPLVARPSVPSQAPVVETFSTEPAPVDSSRFWNATGAWRAVILAIGLFLLSVAWGAWLALRQMKKPPATGAVGQQSSSAPARRPPNDTGPGALAAALGLGQGQTSREELIAALTSGKAPSEVVAEANRHLSQLESAKFAREGTDAVADDADRRLLELAKRISAERSAAADPAGRRFPKPGDAI